MHQAKRWRQELNPLGYRPTFFKNASHRWALHHQEYTIPRAAHNTELYGFTSITRKGYVGDICSRRITQEIGQRERDENVPPLSCNKAYRLFILIKIDGGSQLVNIFPSPDRIMLLLQVGIVVDWLDIWMFPQSREEGATAHAQAFHGLLCGQYFFTPFHNLSFRILLLYLLDIQYVKSYNTYRSIKQSRCTSLLRVLYTKTTRKCNPQVRQTYFRNED